MREWVPCEFSLVRYVPDAARGEFVNVGVVLRAVGAGATALVRFARSWARVRALDPGADLEMLRALEAELPLRLAAREGGGALQAAGGGPAEAEELRPLLDVMEGSWSNAVQVTAFRASLAESLPAEMERLLRLYVDAPRRARRTETSGRAVAAGAMRRAFEGAGVWPLMRKEIQAAQYTSQGDPLRIDCGYRPNGLVRMFQAVGVSGDLDGAKVLAFAAEDLRAGVLRKEAAALELTAVVAPLRDEERTEDEAELYRFAVGMMEREGIRVMTTSDLGRIAETARRELGV